MRKDRTVISLEELSPNFNDPDDRSKTPAPGTLVYSAPPPR